MCVSIHLTITPVFPFKGMLGAVCFYIVAALRLAFALPGHARLSIQ
jgi:hypothetical protein